MQKPEIARDNFVQQPERMRQIDLLQAPVLPVGEEAIARGRLLAATVHGKHRGLGKRRREKGARLVRQVMLDEMPRERIVVARAFQAFLQM